MELSPLIKFIVSLDISRSSIKTHEISEWVVCPCPLSRWTHKKGSDNNPSFNIKVNKKGYSGFHCFTCGHKGSLLSLTKLLSKFSNKIFTESMDILKNFEFFKGVDENPFEFAKKEIIKPLDNKYTNIYNSAWDILEARAYLVSRNISKSTCETLKLGYDLTQNRIIFPVYGLDNNLYGFTGRAIHSDVVPKIRDYLGLPKRSLLLGINLYQKGKPFLVVEGLFGLAHLIEIGVRDFCNPVAILGSEMTNEKSNMLISFREDVYLLTDNDEAGDKCLFGTLDDKGIPSGGGAIDKLYKNCQLFIPNWVGGKIDPDQLTYNEVLDMINHTPIYIK